MSASNPSSDLGDKGFPGFARALLWRFRQHPGVRTPPVPEAGWDPPPVMALRPDHRFPDEMDDIVVKDVEMFRAEAMDDDVWWMCCYFANGEQITFHVTTAKKPHRVVVSVTEKPSEWTDLDAERKPLGEHPGGHHD